MSTLNDYRDEALRIATDHGFNGASVGEEIALMHSELSEALEALREGNAPSKEWYEDKGFNFRTQSSELIPSADVSLTKRLNKPCGVPSEMADVIIRVLHFCGKYGIDIERAVSEKMAYNETRPFKHGKTL
jgi:NTP pyrophosphatase (non-canonical NTP hydrolase)